MGADEEEEGSPTGVDAGRGREGGVKGFGRGVALYEEEEGEEVVDAGVVPLLLAVGAGVAGVGWSALPLRARSVSAPLRSACCCCFRFTFSLN